LNVPGVGATAAGAGVAATGAGVALTVVLSDVAVRVT